MFYTDGEKSLEFFSLAILTTPQRFYCTMTSINIKFSLNTFLKGVAEMFLGSFLKINTGLFQAKKKDDGNVMIINLFDLINKKQLTAVKL